MFVLLKEYPLSVDQSRVFFGKRWVHSIKLGTVEVFVNGTTIWKEFKMYDAFEVPPDAQ